ncbi:MAG: MBL fold metallo-hydrolase [Beutenbergiaceae bacterium]
MRIVKREHACLVVEEATGALVIDPGSWTAPVDDVESVAAVLITHEHADHWTPEHLSGLRRRFPDAPIFGPAGVAGAAQAVTVVTAGQTESVGPFRLHFYGGQHAIIHRSLPVVDNIGVVVNDRFAYGGDSLVPPPGAVEALAVPAGAPWLKLGDAMDYLAAARPEHSFAVHDGVLSPAGLDLAHKLLASAAATVSTTHHRLTPGDYLEL